MSNVPAQKVSPGPGSEWVPETDAGPHWRSQMGFALVADADLSE